MSAMNVDDKYPAITEHNDAAEANQGVLRKGNLEFTAEHSGNGSDPSYQEISGAPVEHDSPLGYHVGWFTIIFLNVGQMIGTGVFSTRIYFPIPKTSLPLFLEREELAKLTFFI